MSRASFLEDTTCILLILNCCLNPYHKIFVFQGLNSILCKAKIQGTIFVKTVCPIPRRPRYPTVPDGHQNWLGCTRKV